MYFTLTQPGTEKTIVLKSTIRIDLSEPKLLEYLFHRSQAFFIATSLEAP